MPRTEETLGDCRDRRDEHVSVLAFLIVSYSPSHKRASPLSRDVDRQSAARALRRARVPEWRATWYQRIDTGANGGVYPRGGQGHGDGEAAVTFPTSRARHQSDGKSHALSLIHISEPTRL